MQRIAAAVVAIILGVWSPAWAADGCTGSEALLANFGSFTEDPYIVVTWTGAGNCPSGPELTSETVSMGITTGIGVLYSYGPAMAAVNNAEWDAMNCMAAESCENGMTDNEKKVLRCFLIAIETADSAMKIGNAWRFAPSNMTGASYPIGDAYWDCGFGECVGGPCEDDADCDGCLDEDDIDDEDPEIGCCEGDIDCDECPDDFDPQPYNPAEGCEWDCEGDEDCDTCPDTVDPEPLDPEEGCEWGCDGDLGADLDCDGCVDSEDPEPDDPMVDCDSDDDGCPNDDDPLPDDPEVGCGVVCEWEDPWGDEDGDGCRNGVDPQPCNKFVGCGGSGGGAGGCYWRVPGADADGDGCVNSLDPAPCDASKDCEWEGGGTPPPGGSGGPDDDTDGDGTPDGRDPRPWDPALPGAPMNPGPGPDYSACFWRDPMGDEDLDGCPNGIDSAPCMAEIDCEDGECDASDPNGDEDGDGCKNGVDPRPCMSTAGCYGGNGGQCNWTNPDADEDGDGCQNWEDPKPCDAGVGCLDEGGGCKARNPDADADFDGCPNGKDPQPCNPRIGCEAGGGCDAEDPDADADEDGCPNGRDPMPCNPAVGCAGPAPPGGGPCDLRESDGDFDDDGIPDGLDPDPCAANPEDDQIPCDEKPEGCDCELELQNRFNEIRNRLSQMGFDFASVAPTGSQAYSLTIPIPWVTDAAQTQGGTLENLGSRDFSMSFHPDTIGGGISNLAAGIRIMLSIVFVWRAWLAVTKLLVEV